MLMFSLFENAEREHRQRVRLPCSTTVPGTGYINTSTYSSSSALLRICIHRLVYVAECKVIEAIPQVE